MLKNLCLKAMIPLIIFLVAGSANANFLDNFICDHILNPIPYAKSEEAYKQAQSGSLLYLIYSRWRRGWPKSPDIPKKFQKYINRLPEETRSAMLSAFQNKQYYYEEGAEGANAFKLIEYIKLQDQTE